MACKQTKRHTYLRHASESVGFRRNSYVYPHILEPARSHPLRSVSRSSSRKLTATASSRGDHIFWLLRTTWYLSHRAPQVVRPADHSFAPRVCVLPTTHPPPTEARLSTAPSHKSVTSRQSNTPRWTSTNSENPTHHTLGRSWKGRSARLVLALSVADWTQPT